MKKTAISMPAANEEATIAETIERTLDLGMENLYLYVVIDTFSHDRTEAIVREYEEKTQGRVRCIFYADSTGVASCYLEGFRQALLDGAEYIIEMDAGGSHDPEELSQFIQALEDGYECVWGSRFIEGGGITNHSGMRTLLSRGGTILSNLVLGTKLKDMTSGYEAFTRDVLEQLRFEGFLSRAHMYQTEMRYYCRNRRYKEVPIHYVGSSSSLKPKSVFRALGILWKLKNNERRVLFCGQS